MKVSLVNPPCSDRIAVDLAPPVWALLLSAIAEDRGHEPVILDLNLEALTEPRLRDHYVYDWSVSRILNESPNVVCFSSMGVNSHVALELARRIKSASRDVVTVFGGPHFGLIAPQMLERWNWVDYVFRGEADDTFGPFLDAIASRSLDPAAGLDGIYRCRGRVVGTPRTLPVSSDEVHSPAYHRVSIARYFARNRNRVLDIDAGYRGCKFACTYCYATSHFGRGGRRPTKNRIIDELAQGVHLGARRFFFVQDNFVNTPAETAALCGEIASARLGTNFDCYATLAQLDDHVVDALAAAGCDAVYVGVDAVHNRARRDYKKQMYRGEADMLRRARKCLDAGIRPTFAFLIDDPSEDRERFEATITAAATARVEGCRVRLNTITPYPGTAFEKSVVHAAVPDDLKAKLAFDVPPVVQRNDFAATAPHLFPFHSTRLPPARHEALLLGAHVAYTLLRSYAETLGELAREGRSWDAISRVVRRLDRNVFLGQSDDERRRQELAAFDASTGIADQPPSFRAERLVVELLRRPARAEYHVLPFAVDIGQSSTLLAVRRGAEVDVREIGKPLADLLTSGQNALAAGTEPPLHFDEILGRLGLKEEISYDGQDQ